MPGPGRYRVFFHVMDSAFQPKPPGDSGSDHNSERSRHKLFKSAPLQAGMPIAEPQSPATTLSPAATARTAGALDDLLHSKSRILRTKLEVLAAEIQARFALWDRNLERIGGEKEQVEAWLNQTTRLARYHLREPNEATRVRESALQLDAQRRQEDIQCWRDVVLVMRDFLEAWEVHEQAKSRAIFINHAGTGTEESV